MARHDKSDFKTINKIERYFICHDTKYVINPTNKLVFINLEGFESFLRWKQKRTK